MYSEYSQAGSNGARPFWRCCPSPGYAQEAILSGTITDSTGGVLPGVTDHRDAYGDWKHLRRRDG